MKHKNSKTKFFVIYKTYVQLEDPIKVNRFKFFVQQHINQLCSVIVTIDINIQHNGLHLYCQIGGERVGSVDRGVVHHRFFIPPDSPLKQQPIRKHKIKQQSIIHSITTKIWNEQKQNTEV